MSLHNVRSKIVRDRGHFRDQNYEMGGNRVKLGVILDFCHCKDKTHIHFDLQVARMPRDKERILEKHTEPTHAN